MMQQAPLPLAWGLIPPAGVLDIVLGVLGLACLVLAVLSLLWTRYHVREILGRSLGRNVREEDETSLKTWMQLSDSQLAEGERELARNPFDRPLDALESVEERLSPRRGEDQ